MPRFVLMTRLAPESLRDAEVRRAMGREEDETVRRWCALALTRLGQGAPLTLDLVAGEDLSWFFDQWLHRKVGR